MLSCQAELLYTDGESSGSFNGTESSSPIPPFPSRNVAIPLRVRRRRYLLASQTFLQIAFFIIVLFHVGSQNEYSELIKLVQVLLWLIVLAFLIHYKYIQALYFQLNVFFVRILSEITQFAVWKAEKNKFTDTYFWIEYAFQAHTFIMMSIQLFIDEH